LSRKAWIAAGVAAVVLVAGGLAAAWFLVVANRPGGHLDTELKGVSVVPAQPAAKPKPKPKTAPKRPAKPRAAVAADKPCWPNFGGDPQRSLARVHVNLGPPTTSIWARGLGDYIEYPPSYCDGRLYVNTYGGRTFAVDALTGKILWSRGGAGPKASTPAIAGSRLIVTSKDGTVTAFDRETGRTLWQIRTQARVESSPVAIDGIAYFGVTDGRLFAVNAANGRIRWAYDTGGRINSSPSVYGNRICITTYAGSIFCLDRRDGRKLWSTYIKRDFARYESFYASPSTDGLRLFTISRSGKVVALRASNGDVLWTHDLNTWGYSTPAVARGRVFIGDFNGTLHCYNAATGREVWRRYVGGRILGPALVAGNLVFFSTLEQKTYGVRFSDGKLVWKVGIGKYAPGIATDRHYFFSLNGILVAYRGRYSPPEQVVRQEAGAGGAKAATGARTPPRAATQPSAKRR
jgi:outer membrane protein assembly factor BamB